jgi:hypothetical protein
MSDRRAGTIRIGGAVAMVSATLVLDAISSPAV